MRSLICTSIILLTLVSCNTTPAEKKQSLPVPAVKNETKTEEKKEDPQPGISYRELKGRDTIAHYLKTLSDTQRTLIASVNRMDLKHLNGKDSLLIPADLNTAIASYSPFPQQVPGLSGIRKIIFFSYPAQFYAAYENGMLKYTGPTNMGRKTKPTPAGVYYCNWKAKKTTSTVNDEWELKWNFNIQNYEGIGFHQYDLPGYPASHSCLRLLAADAETIYYWANQWILKDGQLQAKGTPVVVFGEYPFGHAKPWMALSRDPHTLDISAEQLMKTIETEIDQIRSAQEQRAAFEPVRKDTATVL